MYISLNFQVSNVVLKDSRYTFSQSNWDVCQYWKLCYISFCAVGILDILETQLLYNDLD